MKGFTLVELIVKLIIVSAIFVLWLLFFHTGSWDVVKAFYMRPVSSLKVWELLLILFMFFLMFKD